MKAKKEFIQAEIWGRLIPGWEAFGNKSYQFMATVFCHTKPERARIPGYVSALRLKDGGKQADTGMIYFQTPP
ncbi:MAG: hypothetical protein LBJ60_07980 [Tannerellaceae bacterium]|jgi:hypothetical protein|nr:hypothetical protein [Tannerellaceae bacterium]